jgi:hypothetical protein
MRRVAEKDEVRQLVDELQRDFPLGEVGVAGPALRERRKAGTFRALGILVAECALLLQRRVLLMVERARLAP